MIQKSVIQKFLSVMMLAIFTLSITPQTFLHDLFAGHRDGPAKLEPGKDAQLGKAGVDCHFNDQVATSPFLDQIDEIALSTSPVLTKAITPELEDAVLTRPSYWEGRGPPAIG
ncbi:MAG: hypothetical protein J0M30_00265 [Chitinophagales bacterium]|nr:hypothetical protein [Chitinophagales bacterium]